MQEAMKTAQRSYVFAFVGLQEPFGVAADALSNTEQPDSNPERAAPRRQFMRRFRGQTNESLRVRSLRKVGVLAAATVSLLAVGLTNMPNAGAAVSTTAPYITADGNYGAAYGLGQTTIKCFPDRHQAYFSVSMSDAYGVYDSTGETVQFQIQTYKWNAAKAQFLYYGTTGWVQGTDQYGSTTSWNWWGGAVPGYWRHLVTYRWLLADRTWVTGSEWMGAND